jgi:dCTP deaminase
MILVDSDIAQLIHTQRLVTLYDDLTEQLQPASFDVRVTDVRGQNNGLFPDIVKTDVGWLLAPLAFALATTIEILKMPHDIAGRVEGRSTTGRRGLQVHATAGFIDPGFEGTVTLELFNLGSEPVEIVHGSAIAQIAFLTCTGRAERPYGHPSRTSHYQGQQGTTPAHTVRAEACKAR